MIGIAASRISDKYYKPCIILSVDKTEDGGMIAKGSCRSIKVLIFMMLYQNAVI